MNSIKNFKSKQSIQEEAAEWIIKIDNDSLPESEQQVFALWLTNPGHKKEFLELAEVWGNLDVLHNVAEIVPAETDMPDKAYVNATKKSLSKKKWRSIPQGYYAVAASIAVISFLFLIQFLQYGVNHYLIADETVYSTKVGEQRDIALVDGSVVKLNTHSTVKVDFSESQRSIYLQQGEVNFIVAKDKARPFIVYVGKGSVTAIGTEFNVRFQKGITDVVVTEGIVKVAAKAENLLPTAFSTFSSNVNALLVPENSPATAITSLVAGQKARFDTQKISEVRDIKLAEIQRELSWHSGMLSFADTPLRDVINEVSRNTSTHIIINDIDIANIPVAGYFKAGEIDSMLEVLQLSFGVKVTRMGNEKILLSKSDNFINH